MTMTPSIYPLEFCNGNKDLADLEPMIESSPLYASKQQFFSPNGSSTSNLDSPPSSPISSISSTSWSAEGDDDGDNEDEDTTTPNTHSQETKNDDGTSSKKRSKRISGEGIGVWTAEEHRKFLEGTKLYPKGPWKLVATYIGTRSARQTMTHAQKYRQKLARRLRGLRTRRKNAKSQDASAVAKISYSSSSHSVVMTNTLAAVGIRAMRDETRAIGAVYPSFTSLLSTKLVTDEMYRQYLPTSLYPSCSASTANNNSNSRNVCSSTSTNIPPIQSSHSKKNSSNSSNMYQWGGGNMTVEVPAFEECLDYLMQIFAPSG